MPLSHAGEGRIPVYAPGVLSNPGKYILTRDILNGFPGPAITITGYHVELDLNGFTIDNGNASAAILVNSGGTVTIRNGHIRHADVGIDMPAGVSPFRAVIEDIRIETVNVAGIRTHGTRTVAIRRVTVDGSLGDGIRVEGPDLVSARVENCMVDRGQGVGIYLKAGNGVAVVDSHVDDYLLEGIKLEAVIGGIVRGNNVTSSGGSGGISLAGARGIAVVGNSVFECRSHGIHLDVFSVNALVKDNAASQNGINPPYGDGIRVDGAAVTVEGNVVTENSGLGLHFTATSSRASFGRNSAKLNQNLAGVACLALFPPESCDNGGLNATFGDNLIPALY